MGYHVESGRANLEIYPLGRYEWEIIKKNLNIVWTEDTCGIVCANKGKIMGIVVYNNFAERSCQMHHMLFEPYIIAQGWAKICFDLPFEEKNFDKVWGTIPGFNEKAIYFCERLGFKHITVIPEYWDDVDCHILRLDRDDWRKSKWAGKAEAT